MTEQICSKLYSESLHIKQLQTEIGCIKKKKKNICLADRLLWLQKLLHHQARANQEGKPKHSLPFTSMQQPG